MADKYTNLTALTEFLNNIKTWATALFSPKFSILSYGNSTWDNFIAAYESKTVVYCRASSNSDPSSGSQTRLAFMAYVNNAENPTEVEFQYYRSVSSHSDTQQGDQVFVYKLNKTNGWSVITRNAFTKVDTEKGLTDTYSNGVITLKPKLKSETASSLTAADKGSTTNREYAVGLDASGNLAVNVPWENTTYDPVTTSVDGLMSASDKTKLNGIASGATAVNESTVTGWGFTKNQGTITGITMNGASKGTSGNVDLGTVITQHQDISGKVDKINISAQNTQAVYPIKINAQGQITAYGSAQTIPAAVRVKGNAESTYRTGDVNLTPANIGAAASSHTHGNIQNGGTLQTNDVSIASGDKLVVTDSSDSSKVARTSLSFDGSTTNQFLTKKGTWGEASINGAVYYGDDETTGTTVPINADQLQGYTLSGILALIKDPYPVGSVYQTVDSTFRPASAFGGTWELISSVALASENIFGNGKAVGIWLGSTSYTYSMSNSGANATITNANSNTVGKNAGDYISGSADNYQKAVGVITKSVAGNNPQNTGLIAETVTVYSWKRTA